MIPIDCKITNFSLYLFLHSNRIWVQPVMFSKDKNSLMLVTHLISDSLWGVLFSSRAMYHSVLHLPWANDHGGSLVNVWGLGRLFWKSIKLHYFCGRNIKGGLFCDFKQQVFGLGWIQRQEIFCSSEFNILKPQKGGPLVSGGTFHPSKLLI